MPNVYYGPTYVNSNGAYFPYPQDQGFMRQGRGKDDARALFRSNKGCSDGVDGNGRNGGKRNKGKGRNNKHQRKIGFGLLPSVLTRTSRRKGRP